MNGKNPYRIVLFSLKGLPIHPLKGQPIDLKASWLRVLGPYGAYTTFVATWAKGPGWIDQGPQIGTTKNQRKNTEKATEKNKRYIQIHTVVNMYENRGIARDTDRNIPSATKHSQREKHTRRQKLEIFT